MDIDYHSDSSDHLDLNSDDDLNDDDFWLPSDEMVEEEDTEFGELGEFIVEEPHMFADTECEKFDEAAAGHEYDDPLSGDEDGKKNRYEKHYRQNAKPYAPAFDGTIVFEVGQLFDSVHHFRKVLNDYSIKGSYTLRRPKTDKRRVTAKCTGEGCNWRIHASITPDNKTFMIKTLKEEHTCIRDTFATQVGAKWIAEKLDSMSKANPSMKYELMDEILIFQYGVKAPRWPLYRAKHISKEEGHENYVESYSSFHKYAKVNREANPKTFIKIDLHERNDESSELLVFKRIFICYHAMKMGFLRVCTPFLGLDGCHFKGPFGGILAVSCDGNNCLFLVAHAIVEVESKATWKFFLEYLQICLGDTMDQNFVIMSCYKGSVRDNFYFFPKGFS